MITALLVGGFLLVTSKTDWGRHRIFGPISNAGERIWSGPSVARSAGLSSDELNNIEVYKSAHLATVNITSTMYRRTIFLEVVPSRDQGSGFIISADGKILTNSHVVTNDRQLEVTLSDQTRYKATLINRDEANDLALIQIAPRKKLPSLRLGDSDALQVGQKVLAIGNPFGLNGTLTTGVVSSLGRSIRGENNQELEGLVQTDAAINFGNSGGPLLDSAGDVIGINTAILGQNGSIGIGFAMPINRAKAMLDDFHAGRKPARLGVSTVFVGGDLAEALRLPNSGGLLIQQVARGSAADRAGLHGATDAVLVGNSRLLIGGDLITEIDGKPVSQEDAIIRILNRKHAGDTMDLKVYRNGKTMSLKVTLSEAAEERF
jgi:S1-C subfamily serine protease